MATRTIASNADRLVRVRLVGWIQPTAANHVVDHRGQLLVLPGQGGVVLGVGLGDRAGGWMGDHVEPGVSISHPEPEANRALQVFSCVGNRAVMLDGPAAGASGVVSGKHGAVLVAFDPKDVSRIAPQERVAIDAVGVGLRIDDEPNFVFNSCSPELFGRLIKNRDEHGRLIVPVAASLPAEAAAAGIGMPSSRYDIDLQVDQPPIAELASDLRFGDIIALADHDHRYGRQFRHGWVTVGVICHGQAMGGGHGFGFMSLLSMPGDRVSTTHSVEARLDKLLKLPWADP